MNKADKYFVFFVLLLLGGCAVSVSLTKGDGNTTQTKIDNKTKIDSIKVRRKVDLLEFNRQNDNKWKKKP